MDLSIIIVNYNVKYFLEQCLHSVVRACENIKAEIFVVDNNSTDGSKEWLEEKFPQVYFKWNINNLGFAKANNSVLSNAKGEVVLFLNPDTILPEDCLEKGLQFIKTHEHCGALGVRMIDGSGYFLRESKRSLPTPSASFFKMAGFAKHLPHSKFFAEYYAGHLPEFSVNEVDVLAGAFLMLPKRALEKVVGFDESFFMYAEDIDLSYRVQQAGFKNYYFPETSIIHFKGESTQRESKLYVHRFYSAMQLFVKKHYGQKKISRSLMLGAINFSKSISLGKYYVKKAIPDFSRSENRETLVIADQPYFDRIIQILKHAEKPLVIQGRIALNNTDTGMSMGLLKDIEQIVLKNKTGIIVFCEGFISYKQIIEMVMQLKGKVDFLFHEKGSGSIVGSNSKNKNGVFISNPIALREN